MKRIKRMIFSKVALFALALGMGQSAFAQSQITAAGVIVDASKEPLIGVNVVVQGTNNGTITDFDGNFELTCPAGSKLEISYIGYKTQVLTASPSMKVTLQEDVTELATVEVVAAGYGTMRKSDLTGAIASVAAEDMKQGVVTSSEQLLQGKIAGLTVVQGSGDPTAGAVMRLRGGSSLSGNNAPLVVVDGVANVDMNTIQASDIVSVDVLKDASAAAIYGSRGANGVIIVTTNRKGKGDQIVTSAEYAGYIGVANATNNLELLTADNWGDYGGPNFGADTDWQKEIQQTALTHSHALTFAGSSSKSGFKGNVSYLNSEGVIKTSELERLGASVSGFTTVLKDHVTLEAGLHATRDKYSNVDYKHVFQSAYSLNPTLPIKNADGSYAQTGLDSRFTNPIEYLNNRHDDKTKDRLLVYAKADVQFFKDLKGTVNISRNHQIDNKRLYINKDAQELSSQSYKGNATRDFGDYAEQQLEAFLTYDKTFKTVHKLNVVGGYSFSEAIAEGMGAGIRGFQYDDFLYNNLEAGVYKEYVYSYKNKSNLVSFFGRANYSYAGKYMFTATVRGDGSSKFGKNNKWGVFPSGSAAWRISDEQFMQNTKNWLDNLKLRAGYGITGNQGGIDPYTSLELYATSKSSAGIYQNIEKTYDDDGNEIKDGERVKVIPAQNANPDLKWESTGQFNVGVDFGLFNRLTGTVEFYHKKTKDLLYFYDLGTTGSNVYRYQLLNVGNMTNMGVEVTLNATLFKNDNHLLTADLNVSHNKNEVLKLSNGRFTDTSFDAGHLFGLSGLTGATTQQLREGYSIGSFFGAKYVGKDGNGDLLYKQTLADGTVTATTNSDEADVEYLGCAMPKLTLGFCLNYTFKNWDFSLNTYGMFGQKVYNATRMDLMSAGSRDGLNVLKDQLTDGQTIAISDYWLENASFFRLQSFTVGYTFNIKKINSSLRLYATVDNLFVFTSYKGVDPEVSIDMNVTQELDSNKVYPGIDFYNNYPKPRTFMFGVNWKF